MSYTYDLDIEQFSLDIMIDAVIGNECDKGLKQIEFVDSDGKPFITARVKVKTHRSGGKSIRFTLFTKEA